MFFKEVYEFFGIFGDLFRFLFKLLLFILLWCLPIGLMLALAYYLADKTGIAYQLFMAGFCFIIAVIALYWCYKIWKRPDLTSEQKWALMNGRDLLIVQPEEQSPYEKYKESFNDADKVVKRNQQWLKSKAQCKSADYELTQSGAKYIRIK